MSERKDQRDAHGAEVETGLDTGWLLRLEDHVRAAAVDAPSMTQFVERLMAYGIVLQVQMARSGRVSGVSYGWEDRSVKASVLGPAFTWSGLQKKLGVTYVRQRDQLALETAGQRVAETLAAAPDETRYDEAPTSQEIESISSAGSVETIDAFGRVAQASSVDDPGAFPTGSEPAAQNKEATPTGPPEEWARVATALEGLREEVRQATETARESLQSSAAANVLAQSLEDVVVSVQSALVEAQRASRQAADAATRAKQESLWLALSSAALAALVAALLVGLWMTQTVQMDAEAAEQRIIDHLDKQAAEDPLRQYFERILQKLK
jgi:hypothetical protein